MTAKEQAIDAIRKLPDSVNLDEIMAQLYFRQKVERGLRDLKEGRVVSHEDAKNALPGGSFLNAPMTDFES